MSFFGGGTTSVAPAAGTGFSFGLGTGIGTTPSTFGFGQPAGTTTTTAAPFNFGLGGTSTTTTTAAAPTGSLFGTSAAPAASFNFGLGGAATAPSFATGSLFGPTTTTASTAPFSFGLGGTMTAPTSAPTGGSLFGTTTTTTASTTPFNLGLGGISGSTVVAPAAGSLFGTTTTTTQATSSSGFGTTTNTTPFAPLTSTAPTTGGFTMGLGLPPFGASTSQPTTTTGTSFLAPAPVPPHTMTGGLGGIPGSSINSYGIGTSTSGSLSSRLDQRGIKELPLPAELLVLVDELKSHMKNERIKMAEVSRASYKTVEQVTNVLDETRQMLLNLSNCIQRQTQNCENFRQQMSQDVKDAEMAHMTRETPPALQSDNYHPMEYFFRLLTDYETRMVVYKREIKKAEAAIAALGNNVPITSKDLCLSLKSVKDSLVVIAAKVKTLHDRVTAEVETHQNLLRFVHGDTVRDIFTERSKKDRFNRWDQRSEETTSVLFPTRITDPAKLYMNYRSGSNESPQGSSCPPFGRSSNFAASRHPTYYGGFGSTTLFQSPTSPIFNPHSVTSPPPVSGISLKRTKH